MKKNNWEKHYDDIMRIIPRAIKRWRKKYSLPKEDDDEHYQIALIAAWQAMENYDERRPLTPYLFVIIQFRLSAVMHRAVNSQKCGTCREDGSLNAPEEMHGTVRRDMEPVVYPDTTFEDAEEMDRFWAKVYQIEAIRKEDHFIIPFMRMGMTQREISEITGCDMKLADNARQRVIRKARRHFSRYRYDHEDELFGGKDGRA